MAYFYGLAITKGMPSMGRGKAVAHAGAHAANLFAFQHYITPLTNGTPVDQDVVDWHKEGKGFGTSVILDAGTEENMIDIYTRMAVEGIRTGIVTDNTYPYFTDVEILKLIDPKIHTAEPVILDDGRVLCHREQITAAYAFGPKEELAPFLGSLELLRNDPLSKTR